MSLSDGRAALVKYFRVVLGFWPSNHVWFMAYDTHCRLGLFVQKREIVLGRVARVQVLEVDGLIPLHDSEHYHECAYIGTEEVAVNN